MSASGKNDCLTRHSDLTASAAELAVDSVYFFLFMSGKLLFRAGEMGHPNRGD